MSISVILTSDNHIQLANSNNNYEDWRDNWINYVIIQSDSHTYVLYSSATQYRSQTGCQSENHHRSSTKEEVLTLSTVISLSTLFSPADIFPETRLLWWRKQYIDLYSSSSPLYQHTDILSGTALWYLKRTKITLYAQWGGVGRSSWGLFLPYIRILNSCKILKSTISVLL